MVKVVDAVMVMEERVETEAAMRRTRMTPMRTCEILLIESILGMR